MTFRGIDRQRFAYLLSLGATEFELEQFFIDCRKLLILKGGKVQNLPYGLRERIRTLTDELPPATDEVVRRWFEQHLTVVDLQEAEAVIGVFKRYEEVNEKLSEDSARRFARSCLVHLFSKEPPLSLLNFLKTPVGGQTQAHETAVVVSDGFPNEPPDTAYPSNLPQVLIDLIEGKEIDEHLQDFPSELATFIAGLQAGAEGQTKEAKSAIEALPADSSLRGQLEAFLRRQEARRTSRQTSVRGLQIMDLEIFEGSFDYNQDEVLAYCTRADPPKPAFLHPIAIARGGQIEHLTHERRRELFPETGDLIAFNHPRYPRQPRRGEIGIWRVAEHETTKEIHFHITSDKRTVYEVRSVPFPSTDYDSVREFLKDYAQHSDRSVPQPLLFKLKDNLIVGGRSEWIDFSKDEIFESGLLSWDSLPAFRFDGRLFVPGPLPKEQDIYECESLSSTVRKLFKSYAVEGKIAGGLTKAQLIYLAQLVDSQEVKLNILRMERLKTELESLVMQQGILDALVEELMNHPSVKRRIDDLVKQGATKQLEYEQSLQEEIIRLQRKYEDWEKLVRKKQREYGDWEEFARKKNDEYRKLPDGIAEAVRAAFEKARSEGLSTFAEIAVFQALATPAPVSHTANTVRSSSSLPPIQPTVRDLLPGRDEEASILRAFGLPAKQAQTLALVRKAAHQAGLIVCVKGVAARPAVEGWAAAITQQGILIDSTVGLIDDAVIKDVLARVPVPDVLALLDANFSALDLYTRSLGDLVLARLVQPTPEPKPAIILALAEGLGSLPLPKTFEQISVLLDLDAHYGFHPVSELEDLVDQAMNPDDGSLYKHLWRPAARRLGEQIRTFEPEDQIVALSVLMPHT
ncbi:MAG: hypothetical protein U1F76_29150 [Candidatus Competibacteraceae bacterium]